MKSFFDSHTFNTLLNLSNGWDHINYFLLSMIFKTSKNDFLIELDQFSKFLDSMMLNKLSEELKTNVNKVLNNSPHVNINLNTSAAVAMNPHPYPKYIYKSADELLENSNFLGCCIPNTLAATINNSFSSYLEGQFFLIRDDDQTYTFKSVYGIIVTEDRHFKIYAFKGWAFRDFGLIASTGGSDRISYFIDSNYSQYNKTNPLTKNISLSAIN